MLFKIVCILTLGIVQILFKRRIELKWLYRQGTGTTATHVLIHTNIYKITSRDGISYFEHRKFRFVLDQDTHEYELKESIIREFEPGSIYDKINGVSHLQARDLHLLHGPNRITIESKPTWQMLISKSTEIFYLFQWASVSIWMLEAYVTYAIIVLVMSTTSMVWEIYSTKTNERLLRNLTVNKTLVSVIRESKRILINNENLVIGDAVIVDEDVSTIPCDMILVKGQLIVDESSLTGESNPITKFPLPLTDANKNSLTNIEKQKSSVLFCGSKLSQVIEQRVSTANGAEQLHKDVIGIVIATGFYSSKGELFRSIIYPKALEFKFNQDSIKFLTILGTVAVVAAINHLFESVANGSSLWTIVLGSLDLITIAVPPALPLILTAGIEYAIQRLKRFRIYCINPERVPYAGRLDTICWDKTGTLTTPTMNFMGTKSFCDTSDGNLDFRKPNLPVFSLERFMIACHGVTLSNGETVGFSLDMESFKKTGWRMDITQKSVVYNGFNTPIVNHYFHTLVADRYYTLKRLEFDAHLQLSSVVAFSVQDSSPTIYTKGSPEAIRKICRSLPGNFDSLCKKYSIDGKYLIACAAKPLVLPIENLGSIDRCDLECAMEFLGFLVFENPLRSETISVIKELKNANLSSIIITGDNVLTAIHVAKEVELCDSLILIDVLKDEVCFANIKNNSQSDFLPIEELVNRSTYELENEVAITGDALTKLLESSKRALTESWLLKTRIFARIKPDQKTWIINFLISKGKYVAMCGDGTNDCGALKAAHVGLAFSDAEASIVAPFTSASKSVEDVLVLIRHGRCALETCFLGFKYMALYPIIQLVIVATLNHFKTTLGNNQFLFDDLFVVTGLALLAMYNGPCARLSKGRPGESLFAKVILGSIVGQMGLFVFFFWINYMFSINQPWFCHSSTIIATSSLPASNTTTSQSCFK